MDKYNKSRTILKIKFSLIIIKKNRRISLIVILRLNIEDKYKFKVIILNRQAFSDYKKTQDKIQFVFSYLLILSCVVSDSIKQ